MRHHVGEELLQRFTWGELDEEVAVAVARHLDDCPSCSSRAATAEPLAKAFAAVEDPQPPPELAAHILAELSRRPRLPPATAELVAAAVLLSAAGVVLAAGGDPAGLAAEVASAVQALLTGLRVLLARTDLAPGWSTTAAANVGFTISLVIASRLGAWSRASSWGPR